MTRKDSNPLKVAIQMREAVAYLAVLASRSELEKIAHELLRVHLKLGTQIDALLVEQNDNQRHDTRDNDPVAPPKPLRH